MDTKRSGAVEEAGRQELGELGATGSFQLPSPKDASVGPKREWVGPLISDASVRLRWRSSSARPQKAKKSFEGVQRPCSLPYLLCLCLKRSTR